jgi:hypothetical protein
MDQTLLNPPAIVARAESGIEQLCATINAEWKQKLQAQARADHHCLEIGRLICQYAAKPDIVKAVDEFNAPKHGEGATGGRDKSAYGFVSERLVKCGASLSQRHMERCARAWMKAQEKGLPIDTPLRVVEAQKTLEKITPIGMVEERQPNPERFFKAEGGAESDEGKTPEQIASETAKAFLARTQFHTQVNPAVAKFLAEELNPHLERSGYTILPLKTYQQLQALKNKKA